MDRHRANDHEAFNRRLARDCAFRLSWPGHLPDSTVEKTLNPDRPDGLAWLLRRWWPEAVCRGWPVALSAPGPETPDPFKPRS